GYQRAYQRYEEEKIAAGVPITDPGFFDDFHAAREPIASPSGPEEWFVYVPRDRMREHAARMRWAWGVFGAGLAAMAVSLLSWWCATPPAVNVGSSEGKTDGQQGV